MPTTTLSTQNNWNIIAEVLTNVLKYTSTQDLIQYRLVSRLWHDTATFITRRRGVALRRDFLDEQYFTPMPLQQLSTSPWSSIQLKLFSPFVCSTSEIVAQIGFTMLRVSIEATVSFFPRISSLLRDTPNLRHFHLETKYEETWAGNNAYEKSAAEENFTGNFGTLKEFSFKFYDTDEESANFAKSLINATRCPSGIKSISLELTTLMCEARQEGLLAALPLVTTFGAESVSLKIFYGGTNTAWQILSTRSNATITDLQVEIEDKYVLPIEDYQPLHDFLSSCTGLQKLTLIGLFTIKQGYSGEILSVMRIPPLPVLYTLSLNLVYDSENLSHRYTPCESLTSRDLPQLKSVQVTCDPNAVLNVKHLFGAESPIGTVTTLSVNQGGGPKHWSNVFPNLSTVSIKVRTAAEVAELFEHAAKLESITLKIDYTADVNAVITQGLNQSLDVLQVESLRELQVDDGFRYRTLNNATAVALCLLPPLNLTIDIPKSFVSDSVASLLSIHHRRVEFIKN